MASLLLFLALVFGLAVLVGLLVFAATFAVRRSTSLSPRSDEVLPSHYSSLVATTPSKYPGYCPECGTNNDPEYSVCRNCSSKLPESRYDRGDRHTNSILNE